jgi:hypothetical protein
VVVRLEVAITPAGLPTGADKIRIDGMSASVEHSSDWCWRITLSNLRSRALGLVRLPISDVEIALSGYSRTEAKCSLDRFHLSSARAKLIPFKVGRSVKCLCSKGTAAREPLALPRTEIDPDRLIQIN